MSIEHYKAAAERTDEAERLLIPPFKRVAIHTADQTIWHDTEEAKIQGINEREAENAEIERLAERWGGESEPFSHEETEARREAWNE